MKDHKETKTAIEPGLLGVFRLLTALWLATEILTLTARLAAGDIQVTPKSLILELSDTTLLLLYLSFPVVPRILGRWYLPLGIILATAGPIITEALIAVLEAPAPAVMFFRSTEAPSPLLFFASRAVIPVVYFPLILTAWQYRMRGVIVFSVGYMLLNFLVRDLFSPWPFGFAPVLVVDVMRTLGLMLIGYLVARLMDEQRKQRQELAEAHDKLLRFASTLEQLSVSRERNRLAHELHDTLAHTQSALAVQLEGVNALWNTEPDEAYALLQKSVANTRAGLVETRRALQALRASPLEELGPVLAIRELAEAAQERGGFQVDVSLPEVLDDVEPEVEQCVYRVTQEALENIVRHANAQNVSLTLTCASDALELSVCDDGEGFDLNKIDDESTFGLRGMAERVKMVGGALKVESTIQEGTHICLRVKTGL